MTNMTRDSTLFELLAAGADDAPALLAPGRPSLSFAGLRNSALFAVPIGIMAAGQTMLMLTGGIDLSIAMIATGAAYVAADQSPNSSAIAILVTVTVSWFSYAEKDQ